MTKERLNKLSIKDRALLYKDTFRRGKKSYNHIEKHNRCLDELIMICQSIEGETGRSIYDVFQENEINI